jgi:hypothetical protein
MVLPVAVLHSFLFIRGSSQPTGSEPPFRAASCLGTSCFDGRCYSAYWLLDHPRIAIDECAPEE